MEAGSINNIGFIHNYYMQDMVWGEAEQRFALPRAAGVNAHALDE